jgi:hypothetical protein
MIVIAHDIVIARSPRFHIKIQFSVFLKSELHAEIHFPFLIIPGHIYYDCYYAPHFRTLSHSSPVVRCYVKNMELHNWMKNIQPFFIHE